MSGDNMHNSAKLLPELLHNGIRLLIYAGEDDFMCESLFFSFLYFILLPIGQCDFLWGERERERS